ncbi:MAG: hypothetical protein BWY77_01084 [bacterium ADurb.Bin431]|nr:MAG: hypothetical protein BWY77_01084 [bacterium ADurb.Bin431]
MGIDHRQALTIIAPHLLLPLPVEDLAPPACRRPDSTLGREGQRPREAVREFLQGLLAMLAYNIADEGIAAVVGALVAEAVLAKNPHFVIGQLLTGHNRRTDEHIAMAVPQVVLQPGSLDLGHPLRHPHRHRGHGHRIRGDDVGITIEHIVALLRLIAEGLQVKGGDFARQLARGPEGDHVGKLVGDDIAQPIVGAAQNEGHLRRPDLHLVVIIVGGAVGVVVVILDDEMDGAVRTVVIETGNGFVDLFRHLGDDAGGAFGPLMKMDLKMVSPEGVPIQFGMVDRLLLGMEDWRSVAAKDKNESRPSQEIS